MNNVATYSNSYYSSTESSVDAFIISVGLIVLLISLATLLMVIGIKHDLRSGSSAKKSKRK